MAYKPKDIYRGRRKFRLPLTIFLFAVVFVLVGGIGMFFFLQRYIVYEAGGVTIQFPSQREEEYVQSVQDTPQPTFEPVAVEIVWEDPDFSDVDLGGWEELKAVKARFIPLDTVISGAALDTAAAAAQAEGYDCVVLEMKSADGRLAWPSASQTAFSYGTAGAADVTPVIASLHESGFTVAAQMSCFADGLMWQRNWPVALQYNGSPYRDSDGKCWLDPYNRTVRSYLAELAQELAAMGFDEIILADLYHPAAEGAFTYTVTMQTAPDPVTAVCQAGRRIVEAVQALEQEDRETPVAVSARIDAASMRGDMGAQTGQDLDIFWRLFARLYCPSDYNMAADDQTAATKTMTEGRADIRFVPVSLYAPEGFDSYLIYS